MRVSIPCAAVLLSMAGCAASSASDESTATTEQGLIMVGPITKAPTLPPGTVKPIVGSRPPIFTAPLNPAVACAARVDPLGGAPAATKLLIVGPASFLAEMNRLRDHKNATGMPAYVLTMEGVRCLEGKDDAEKLKHVIATMHEQHGTRYVMLAGDPSLVPARHRFIGMLPSDPNYGPDGSYLVTDNYYANLYHHEGPLSGFDTWDADGNGRYDDMTWGLGAVSYNPDHVDGLPDVAVGRVPAHVASELGIYVDKVIRYETGGASMYGLNRVGLVAGGTYGQASADFLDQLARNTYLDQVATFRAALNYDTTPNGWAAGNFGTVDAFMLTMGWVSYNGHGAQNTWDLIENGQHYDVNHVRTLQNRNLPIVFAAACETAKFMANVPGDGYLDVNGNPHHIYVDNASRTAWDTNGTTYAFPFVLPQPGVYDPPSQTDISMGGAWLFPPTGGGAIAYFGDNVILPDDRPIDLETDVLNAYQSEKILGDMYTNGARTYYVKHHAEEDWFWNPRLYLSIMTLFGDPSLRLQ